MNDYIVPRPDCGCPERCYGCGQPVDVLPAGHDLDVCLGGAQ